MHKKFSVLFCGAFGYGNFGDNLLRDVAVSLFRKAFPDIDIFVDRPYPNKELIDYVDLRIIGPGGLLYESNKVHNEYYKMYAKKPFILFGTGFSIANKYEMKEQGLCETLIKGADLIIDRHMNDLSYIHQFRSLDDNVYIYPDISFFSRLPEVYKTYIGKTPNIVLNVGQQAIGSDADKENLKKQIKDCHITRLLSLSTQGDSIVEDLRKSISEGRTINDYYFDTFTTVCSIINEADLLITGRYHATIIGLLLGKKIVILPRHDREIEPKMSYTLCPVINWDELKENPQKYIDSIPVIKTIEGFKIEHIRNKRVHPMMPVIMYMKERFNIDGGQNE